MRPASRTGAPGRALAAAALLLLAPFAATDAAAQPSRPSASSSSRATDSWRGDVPCTSGARPTLRLHGAPRPDTAPACVRTHCVDAGGGRRVCTCLHGTTDITSSFARINDALWLESGGKVLREVPVELGAEGGARFEVSSGDLDGDGRGEVVVGLLNAVSNGLGVEWWTVYVFDGRDLSRAPLVFRSQQFSTRGSWLRPAAGGACRLLATRWAGLDDPRRGPGTYFIGQWLRYADGRLVPDTTRPAVRRRLLNSFGPRDAPDAPWALLRDRRAEASAAYPVVLPPLAGRERGTLRRAGDTLVVALESGRTLTYLAADDYGGPGPGLRGAEMATALLVDGATGRPFPTGYLPSDPRLLEGRPVTVMVHEADGMETHRIVIAP